MFKANYKYLSFDDRLFIFIGIPVVTFFIKTIFFDQSLDYIFSDYGFSFISAFAYTGVYWFYCRQLLIFMRKKYPKLELTKKRVVTELGVVLVSIPFFAFLFGGATFLISRAIGFSSDNEPGLLLASFATFFVSCLILLVYELIYIFDKYRITLESKKQIELAHVQAQLENLRNQISPHFLFNSLNTLMNLIPKDSDRAMRYLSKLSKFYRYSVKVQDAELINLEEEIKNARIFADLLHERFYNAIKITFPSDNIENTTLSIIPICLQLLLENAIKHNIVSQAKPLYVDIKVDNQRGYIFVRNNLQLKIEEIDSTGTGLKNIMDRVGYFTDKEVIVNEDQENFIVGIPLINRKGIQ